MNEIENILKYRSDRFYNSDSSYVTIAENLRKVFHNFFHNFTAELWWNLEERLVKIKKKVKLREIKSRMRLSVVWHKEVLCHKHGVLAVSHVSRGSQYTTDFFLREFDITIMAEHTEC